MTRAMFNEHLRAFDRLWRWITVAVCLFLVLAFAAGPPLARVLPEPWLGRPEGLEERQVRILIVPSLLMGVALLLLVLVSWGRRWTAMKFGLRCPSCVAPLTGKNRHAALGRGKCGRCQAQVVEDAPAPLGGVPLPTHDEFLARLGGYKAANARQGLRHVCAVLLSLPVGGLAAAPVGIYVAPILRPTALYGLAVLLFFASMVFPLLVCWYYLRRWESRLQQSHGLACCWCGAALTGANGKTATGRCGGCGQPAYTDVAEPALQLTGPA
jgi:hypothetical protein